MKHRPRLGIHCPGTGTGGPWRYVHSLLKHIDLNEFDVQLLCDIDGVYAPRPDVNVITLSKQTLASSTDVPVIGTAIPNKPSIFRSITNEARVAAGFFRTAWRLSRSLRRYNLDIVHMQETGCEEAPVAARFAGIPHVLGTFHTDWTYDLHHERESFGYQLMERASNRSLDAAIAVSEATGRNWRRRTFLPRHRILTIHNGIDPDRFIRRQSRSTARAALGLPGDRFIVIGLGRLDEAKGFADLIDAAAHLRAAVPNLLIAIAGEGPLRTALDAQVDFKGLRQSVTFLGFQKEVQPVLDAADAFALPSLCEACPYAVLEAMASGLPVLGSDVGGVRELIDDGKTGLLLPPRDAATWASAIRTLATDSGLRERFGRAGRERVNDRFQEQDMIRRTFDVYRRFVERPR